MSTEESPRSAPTGTGNAPAQGSERFHSLDALRAFALLLGVLFHAAESFEPGVETYWAIADCSSSGLLGLVRHACHSFRMELFFLVAGFFAHLLYHRRGWKGFVRNRASRILVPLVVGWVLLYPVLVYLWLLGAKTGGRLPQLGVPPDMAHTPVVFLTAGFFFSLQFVKQFDLTHLWFLHQLLVVYAVVLLLRAGWSRGLDPAGARVARVDAWVAWLCGSRWKVVLLAVVTVPMLMLMQGWSVDTPKGSLWPHLPTTLLYGFVFALGWLVHRHPHLLDTLSREWWMPMFLGVLLVWPTDAGVGWLAGMGIRPAAEPWVRWVHAALYALMMWGFVLGFLGLFVRHCSARSALWRYVADASYWIYLVHLPLVVWLQILVGRWPLHWSVKYPLVVLVAMPALFLSYHYLVRHTFIGAQLNGRKEDRVTNRSFPGGAS